jgi:hypothetical protein
MQFAPTFGFHIKQFSTNVIDNRRVLKITVEHPRDRANAIRPIAGFAHRMPNPQTVAAGHSHTVCPKPKPLIRRKPPQPSARINPRMVL